MKKIEAVVLASREKNILDALRKSEIGGLTVIPGKGRGQGPRNVQPGPGRYIEKYNDVLIFCIVVEDSKVDEVVSAIIEASHTGNLGDGKIFISTVDDVIDITTKQKREKCI